MADDISDVIKKYCTILTYGEAIGVLQMAIMDIYMDSNSEDEDE